MTHRPRTSLALLVTLTTAALAGCGADDFLVVTESEGCPEPTSTGDASTGDASTGAHACSGGDCAGRVIKAELAAIQPGPPAPARLSAQDTPRRPARALAQERR